MATSRTELLAKAAFEALADHREEIDADEGLRSVTVTLKLVQGRLAVRSAVVERVSERTLLGPDGSPPRKGPART